MKFRQRPLVEVIVITYNHESFIEECIDSICNQEVDFNFRVIVHDDCSTDNTQEILRILKKKHKGKMQLILQNENQFSRGINITSRLLLRAKAKYVAFCEGDDYWTNPKKLQMQVDFLEKNKWCNLVHSGVELVAPKIETDHIRAVRNDIENNPLRSKNRVSGVELAKSGNYIFTCTAVFRRHEIRNEVLRLCDGLRPTDLIVFALASETGDIGYIQEELAAYRIHENNSWANLPVEIRIEKYINVLWFLSGVLKPNLSFEFREKLIQLLYEFDGGRGSTTMTKLQKNILQQESDITSLKARVEELELQIRNN